MKPLDESLGIDPGISVVEKGVSQLRALGVREGGVLLVHSSFTSVRSAAGTIEAVIAALAAAVGGTGTLLIPALSFDEVTKTQPVFDRDSTPSCIGAIPEFFRRLPCVTRSVHPTHSVCGIGARADEILGSHHQDTTPVGEHSPFRALRDLGGQVLMLGCSLVPMTSMHGVEEAANAPYIFGSELTYTIKDGNRQYETKHKRHGFDRYGQRYDRLADVLVPPSLVKGTVFGAETWLVEAKAMWDAAADYIRREPYYFVEEVG